jgi:acyl transferase domain-containing protein
MSLSPIDSTAITRQEPIAITGIGCRFPGGAEDPGSYWKLLCDEVDAVTEVPAERFDLERVYDPRRGTPGKIYSRFGAFLPSVDRFDAAFFGISPREARHLDPQQRLLLEVSWEALQDAGAPHARVPRSRTGVFVGMIANDYMELMHRSGGALDLYSLNGGGRYGASGRISYCLGLEGPSLTADTACSTSLVILHLACQSLWSGECDVALAGGAHLILQPQDSVSMCQGNLLSADGRCKFGDASADGYVRGEAVAVVALKRLSQAVADGDRIYAVIRGTAVNNDGASNGTLSTPSTATQVAMLRAAYRRAGVAPGQVRYIEAQGTGTTVGDRVELEALATVLAQERQPEHPCFVGSVRTNLGHAEGASGMASLIKLALCLYHREIPRSLHCQDLNPTIPWSEIPLVVQRGERIAWPDDPFPAFGGVNSFGFSGTNAHAVLEEPPRPAPPPGERPMHGPWLVTVTARSPKALRAAAAGCQEQLAQPGAPEVSDVAFTTALRRTHLEHRAAVVAGSQQELRQRLQAVAEERPRPGVATGHAVAGDRPHVAFLFPGEGWQWHGMGRELLAAEPAFRAALEECSRVIEREAGCSPLAQLLAAPEASRLDELQILQPTLFAFQVALAALWRSWGIRPDAVVGHGLGEIAAAHVAGNLPLEDAARMLREPVRSSSAVDLLAAEGCSTFVEMSAHPVLLPAIEQELQRLGRSGRVLPSLRRHEGERATLLGSLAELYVRGAEVNWAALHPAGGRSTGLPRYPWQRERFWIDLPPGAVEGWMGGSPRDAGGHPLLGMRLDSSIHPGTSYWETELSLAALPYLADHRVRGRVLLPGAAYLEMALSAAFEVFGAGLHEVQDLEFLDTLVLPVEGRCRLQTCVTSAGSGRASFRVSSLQQDGGQGGSWTLQARGVIRLGDEPLPGEPAPPEDLRAQCREGLSGAEVYARMAGLGLEYGPAFQGIEQAWLRPGEALAGLRLRPEARSGPRGYQVHPALLDAALQLSLLAAGLGQTEPGETLLPIRLERLHLRQPPSPGGKVWAHARLRPDGSAREPRFDVALLDGSGARLLEARGLVVRRARRAADEEAGERRGLTEDSIRGVVARLLGLAGPEEVDPRRPLGELGLGSLGAVELRNALSLLAGRPLSAALVYNYPTVEALVGLLGGEARPAEAPVGGPGSRAEAGTRVRSRIRGQASDEPVALIGIGCRFPGGVDGPEAFWKLLCAGVDAVTEVPAERWDVDAYYDPDPHRPGKMSSRWGSFLAEADRFDSAFFQIAPREAAAMDPQQRLLLEVAWEALENAGVQPDRLAGTAAGVFVGMCSNSYWDLHMAQGGTGSLDGDFITGNLASVASGRLSYFLGIHGPSLTVDTACSSSLVAVHLACQSLRRRESDLALASGVNLILSPDFHMLSSRLGVMARNGRCKTFDAAADGYSRGEGCGVVVLKRLSDALADRDPILAVVRGSAMNQDGRSTALTAPSGRAQEAVVRAALEDAGLPPAAIDYVEAHGSATPLGDVIELHALAAIHGSERPEGRPLWVGSVKTNFGHLEAASGIAGLIKAALSVAHGQVPANLHFQTPNPEVPFTELGLRVPGALEPWPAGDGLRRAGVSAFGLSGTNAHVVLEAPTALPQAGKARPWQLLPLSARTREGLETATARLAHHLREHPDLELADVAFTLQTGRRRFTHRRAVLARDLAEAVTHLESLPPRRAFTQADPATERPLVFLFPGVGDHYVGMAAGLYRDEPVFREALDRCSEILLPILGEPLPELLFPAGVDGEADGGEAVDLRRMLRRDLSPQDGAAGRLAETAVAQPVVFAVEYALTRLLLDWGLQPQALVGYSLGEYVAACVAGVFPLEDALRLVAERARWIQELPPGAMLAVPLPPAELEALLPPDLSLAAVNGPSLCVVAGPVAAVAALERRLGEAEVVCTRLQATHAFHSREMEPLRERLTELVRSLRPAPPRIPFLSNVTGTWITEEEATDPGYWARHLCQPVRFETAAAELLREPSRLFLEVGPGQSLGAFLKQHPLCPPAAAGLALPALRHAYERQGDLPFLLATLGRLWLAGAEVDWAGVQHRVPRRRVPLPTYPFERQRHWLAPAASSRPAAQAARQGRWPDPADWFSLPVWQETAVPPPAGGGAGGAAPEGPWLAFVDETGLGAALVERLRQSGRKVVAVRPGAGFSDLGWGTLEIDPRDPADYQRVLGWLERPAARVVHLWGLDGGRTGFDEAQDRGFYSVLFLAQALARQAASAAVEIRVVTSGLQKVTGGEELRTELSTLIGLCRVIPQEHPNLPCRIIDVEPPGPGRNERLALDLLVAELAVATPEPVVAYRGTGRWVQRFERLRLEAPSEPWPRLRQGGVYLVIGGMGGIGSALAARLARDLGAKLVLTGRSPVPERGASESWQEARGEGDRTGSRVAFLRELERAGAEVLAVQADAADETAMRHAVELAEERFGALHGVFHTAGLVGRGAFVPITALGRADCAAHFQAKAHGMEVLERVLRGREPELVVLFSSLSAVLGGQDFAAYAAANAYLDAFAQARAGEHPARWLSIDWDTWQVEALEEHLAEMGSQLRELEMTPEEGLEAFRRVLAGVAGPRAVHSLGDLGERLERWVRSGAAAPRSAEVQALQGRPELATPYTAPRTPTEATVAGLWQEVLGIAKVGVHDDFLELGGHSLSALQLLARLRQRLGVELPLKAVFEAPSPAALADLIDSLAPPQDEEEVAMGEMAEGFL